MGKTHSTLGGNAASSETASHARSQYFNAAILRGESPTTETQLRRQKVFGQALPALRRGELPPLADKHLTELFMKLRVESNTVYQEKNYLYAAQLYSLGLMVAHQLKDSDVPIAPHDFSFMHSARAACLIRLEQTDAVMADCDQALAMDPDNIQAYRLKVEAMMSEQKYHEAVIIAEQGARRVGQDSNEVKILCKLKKDLNDRLQGSPTRSDGPHQVEVEGFPLPEIKLQRSYLRKLGKYNKDKIKHTKQDLRMRTSDYIQLHMYSGHNHPCLAERRGIKEVDLHEQNITKVDLESIFKLPSEMTKNQEEPRLVLMLGSPGSGKTHTCLHIVDSAVNGQWEYPDTTPFFFRMKDIHKYETSLKDFLLDRCGPECNKDEVWQMLKDNDQFFLIVDGLDECPLDFLSEPQTIQNTEEKAGIGIILNSLIRGFLLPNAKILLTSRVYSTEKAISAAERIVELGGIPTAKLWKMFQGELNEVEYQLAREMLPHDDLLSLAKLPVNAFGLVDYFKYMKPGKIETQTELLFSITMAKMVKCNRNPKMNDITTIQQAVGQQAQVLREIAGLSMVSIDNTIITVTFTREELHERGVTDAAIECGLLAGYVSSLKHRFGERNEERFHIPHLATLELLAGLGNTQKDIESLLCLVGCNNGQLDMVIMFTAGMMGNPGLWPVLRQVFPETMTDTYADKAEKMMTAVLTSSRRHTLGGELFVIHTIGESLQWQLAPDVQRSLTGMSIGNSVAVDRQPSKFTMKQKKTGRVAEPKQQTLTAVGLSDYIPSSSTSPPTQMGGSLLLTRPLLNAGDSIALGKLLTHTAMPYSQVNVWGDIGINGLSRLAASAPCVSVQGTPISAPVLQQSHDQLTGLHVLGLTNAGISRYTLPVIAQALAELRTLDTLDLSFNPLGVGSEGIIQQTAARSSLGVISHQHRYLRLAGCDLTNTDISALLSVSTRPASLLHLDITRNKLSGVDELVAYMARPDTVLQGLLVDRCGVGETCESLIQALQANRKMRCLELARNEGIPAVVCEMLGALLSAPDTVLEELLVASCNLDVSALLYPLTLPTASPHVTILDLTNNDTARHAIAQLCQIMTCTRATSPLCCISLGGCRLQDNHLDQLTRALSDVSSKLTTLNVSSNTDLTISSINRIINKTRLDQLWVADCRLSSDDYVQLFTAISRPDCSIKWLATGEPLVIVDLRSGLQQLSRPLDKLLMFCYESQREVLGECVDHVEEQLGAPGMIICSSCKYMWNLYIAESGADCRHLPPHARELMIYHPGWHDL